MASWKYFVVRKPYGMSPAAKCSLPEKRNQASYVKITLQDLSRKTVSEDIPGRKTAIRSGQQSHEFFSSAIDESLKRYFSHLFKARNPYQDLSTAHVQGSSRFSQASAMASKILISILSLHDPDLLLRQSSI